MKTIFENGLDPHIQRTVWQHMFEKPLIDLTRFARAATTLERMAGIWVTHRSPETQAAHNSDSTNGRGNRRINSRLSRYFRRPRVFEMNQPDRSIRHQVDQTPRDHGEVTKRCLSRNRTIYLPMEASYRLIRTFFSWIPPCMHGLQVGGES